MAKVRRWKVYGKKMAFRRFAMSINSILGAYSAILIFALIVCSASTRLIREQIKQKILLSEVHSMQRHTFYSKIVLCAVWCAFACVCVCVRA